MEQTKQSIDRKIAMLIKHVKKAKKQSHLLYLMKNNGDYKNIEIMLNQVNKLFEKLRKEISNLN